MGRALEASYRPIAHIFTPPFIALSIIAPKHIRSLTPKVPATLSRSACILFISKSSPHTSETIRLSAQDAELPNSISGDAASSESAFSIALAPLPLPIPKNVCSPFLKKTFLKEGRSMFTMPRFASIAQISLTAEATWVFADSNAAFIGRFERARIMSFGRVAAASHTVRIYLTDLSARNDLSLPSTDSGIMENDSTSFAPPSAASLHKIGVTTLPVPPPSPATNINTSAPDATAFNSPRSAIAASFATAASEPDPAPAVTDLPMHTAFSIPQSARDSSSVSTAARSENSHPADDSSPTIFAPAFPTPTTRILIFCLNSSGIRF